MAQHRTCNAASIGSSPVLRASLKCDPIVQRIGCFATNEVIKVRILMGLPVQPMTEARHASGFSGNRVTGD